jgi:hypothetical protein
VGVSRGARADASALAVEGFDAPDDLRPGGVASVNVTVRNVGRVPFEGQLVYRLDAAAVATDWTRVPVGESRTVTFRADYADVDRAAVPLSSRDTVHGVWVGNESLRTRPITVHAPVRTPTATPTATATFAPSATPVPTPTATPSPTAAPSEPGTSTCRRGFVTRCGGAPVDQTTLTVIGTVASTLGIIYELFTGG